MLYIISFSFNKTTSTWDVNSKTCKIWIWDWPLRLKHNFDNYWSNIVLNFPISFIQFGIECQIIERMFYFILHLSIADLLTAFFTLLPEVVWTLTFPDFHGGVVMCKFVKFTQMLGPYLSSYILIMTAVDRYQAICNPLGNCTWTPKRSKVRFLFHISYVWKRF